MPKNRPGFTVVYIPEKQQVKQNTNELNRAVVIDAKLRPNHMTLIIQSVLMLNCQLEYPYVVTHMSEAQYLLLLPVGVDHLQFLEIWRTASANCDKWLSNPLEVQSLD